jgi:uncharacterized protein YggE
LLQRYYAASIKIPGSPINFLFTREIAMRLHTISFCLVLFSAIEQSRAAEEQPRTISTSGEAVIYVQPDEVILNFGVDSRDAGLDKAVAANEAASAKLLAAVKKLGIEDKYIQTDNLDVSIVYRDHNALAIDGYDVERSYCVKLKDIKKFQTLVETVLKNGANRIGSFDFRTTELRKHRDKARAMAIEAAKEKAIALAGELKCKVGPPRTINENAGYWGGYGGYNRYANATNSQIQVQSGGGGDADDKGQLPLGQISVRANVSVTFDLVVSDEPAKN